MEPLKTSLFDYTTKYLSDKDDFLEKTVEKQIEQLLGALKLGNWSDPIFKKRSQLPGLALRCYQEKTISKEQFATLMIYWSALRHHPHRDITPYECKSHFPLVQKTFTPTEKIVEKNRNHYHKDPYLSLEQETRFLKLIQEAPESERFFFLIPDFQHGCGEKHSISQAIAHTLAINVFNRVLVDGKTMRMIPSFTMMQAFLTAFAGKESAVELCPGLGVWEWEDIRQDHLEGLRVLGLPFPSITLPGEADGYSTPQEYDFIYHDFYHAIIISHIPLRHRKAFMAIEKILHDFQNEVKNEAQKLYLSKISEKLIDMEYSSYRREKCHMFAERFKEHYTQDIIFWDALRETIYQALEGIQIDETERLLKIYPEPVAKLRAKRLITQLQFDDNVIPQVAKKILKNLPFETYGIHVDTLEHFKSYVISDIEQELKKKHQMPPNKVEMETVATRDIILQLCEDDAQ